MKIDGKAIAETLYTDLGTRIRDLKQHGITPTLAVVLIGDDAGSMSYVRQKELHAREIGITLTVDRLPKSVTKDQLKVLLESYNSDHSVHAIIVQRPTPDQITSDFLDTAVIPEKDVDGFHPNSDFAAPVALAVERILYEVFKETQGTKETKGDISSGPSVPSVSFDTFSGWLLGKHVTVVGKGITAGAPIINHFHGRNAQVSVIDSETEHPETIIADSDIVISAVGKAAILPIRSLHKGTILIGVGLHDEEGKLRGDYDEREVETRVAAYTPTPGGVGPVNVAMLLDNVVRAAEEQSGQG